MNRLIKYVVGMVLIFSLFSLSARQWRIPLDLLSIPIHYQYFLDSDESSVDICVWGGSYYKTADETLCSNHGTDTQPLAALLFGDADFTAQQVFSPLSKRSLVLGSAKISPRFTYSERGVVLGAKLEACHNDINFGVRVEVPFSIIDLDRRSACGQLSSELGGGDLFDEFIRYKAEEVADQNGNVHGITNFAYRLDFLSQLGFDPTASSVALSGSAADQSFVNYKNPDFVYGSDDQITIANLPVTRRPATTGSIPVFVYKSTMDEVPDQFHQLETVGTPGTSIINGDGSFATAVDYGYFIPTQDYTDLGSDSATQEKIWIIPSVHQEAASVSHTLESQEIRRLIDDIVSLSDDSFQDFLTRQGVCFASQRAAGIGDLRVEFFVDYCLSDRAYAKGVFGVTLPTAETIKDARVLMHACTGNNGHFELKFGSEVGWEPFSWVHLKADAAYSLVLSAQEKVAAAFGGATIKNIGPTVNADISWGYFLGHIDLTFVNQEKWPLGFNLGYELYAKRKDNVAFCTSSVTDYFGQVYSLDSNALASRTDTIAHKARVEFFYQGAAFEFFAGWTQVFAGKNVPKESSCHLGLMVAF